MESRAKLDFILADFRRIVTDAGGFYREMNKTGGFADPIIFLLVMAVIAGVLMAVVSLFGIGFIGAMAAGFAAIITMPIAALIGSFIGAAVMFVIWKLMGSNENFETSYRCIAYAGAIYPVIVLFGMIPYLGTLAGAVWGIYLLITASVEVHQLQRKSAMVVIGILGGLMLLLNLSSEYAARHAAGKVEEFSRQMEDIGDQFKDFEDMTPEEAGQAMGEFLKGMKDAAEEAGLQNGETATQGQSTQAEQTLSDAEEMSPEEAGRALGEFFKGLEEATREMREKGPGDEGAATGSMSAEAISAEDAAGAN